MEKKSKKKRRRSFKSFKFEDATIDAMLAVLEFGDKKHPGNTWKNDIFTDHVDHLVQHYMEYHSWSSIPEDILDKETEINKLAHVAVRAMMALDAELRRGKHI